MSLYPAVGEVFELTLDGDALETEPMEMVLRDRNFQPDKWKYRGERVFGNQTRQFRLIRLPSSSRNLMDVRFKLRPYGKTPKGQWREALRVAYSVPSHDDESNEVISIADDSWVNHHGLPCFPWIRKDGSSGFMWSGLFLDDSLLWLVDITP